jgi:predicted aspartyl protease
VSITLEQRQPAFMLIDTGASATIITPVMLRLLGLSVPEDAPRRELRVAGGRKIEVPFVRLASIGLGDTILRDVEVGVYDVAPQAPVVDGLLGGDILQRFRPRLDADARQLHLVPLRTRGARQ